MKTSVLNRILLVSCILFQRFERTESAEILGRISGKTMKVLDKYIHAYLGIPFASPPLGSLRFQKPQPVKPWNSVYRAIRKPASCMQEEIPFLAELQRRERKDFSEDCLYLNVWVPANKENRKPFATMVWIYGGAFQKGTSNLDIYDGRVIAALGNVIVVTFNYRVGAFGYANFDQEGANGNMGMLDQVKALKWVHRNIEAFGGDKDLITIFGESAGSVSAAHHLISPLTKGLFKRAILQSGSNYHKLYAVDPAVNAKSTRVVSEKLGCIGDDILNCMRKKNASDIVEAEESFLKEKEHIMTFPPQNGAKYLPDNHLHAMNEGQFHNVEIMMGETKHEGTFFVCIYKPEFFSEDNPVLSKSDAKYIMSKFFEVDGESLDRMWSKYLENISEESSFDVVQETAKAMGEGAFTCPIFQLAEKLSKYNRKVYHYTFNYTRKMSIMKEWMGVYHSEDIAFVFGMPLVKEDEFTSEESELSMQIIELWTSFAKTGKPSYTGIQQEWKPFDSRNRNSLYITLGNIHNEARLEGNCKFWKEFYSYNS